jgi:predicted acetyltransferase
MREQLILRPMVLSDEPTFRRALGEWDGSSGFLFYQGFEPGMTFADYLDLLAANERGERLPPGFIAATTLGAFVGEDLVGRASIRHRLTEFLLNTGGHLGYGVVPSFRRRGYATEILRQTLPLAKKLRIDRALVTCDDDNIGSIRVIEVNGGVLEDKRPQPGTDVLKRRYWIVT